MGRAQREGSGQRTRWGGLMKILIENIDFPPVKVRCVEKIVTVGDAESLRLCKWQYQRR